MKANNKLKKAKKGKRVKKEKDFTSKDKQWIERIKGEELRLEDIL